MGVNVFWHTVVGDNPQRLKEALDIARKRADVIITTGGLGPTYDDLTKQTICEAFGKPLVFHPDILETIRVFFERNAHIKMPENNRPQAELPEDCVVFDNPVGTAPGCAFEADGVHVLMMPGPPFEMLTMLRRCAIPYLRGISHEVILSHDIMTFGLGESPMEELLRDNGIPCITKNTLGAGLTSKIGSMRERVRFYVPYLKLKIAKALEEEFFSAKFDRELE